VNGLQDPVRLVRSRVCSGPLLRAGARSTSAQGLGHRYLFCAKGS
jgi:hypothetical protein